MYKIDNDEVVAAIEGYSRTFRAMLEFADGSIVSGADVGIADVEHSMSDDNTIPIGKIISRRAEIKLYCRRRVRRGEVFKLFIYLIDFNRNTSSERTTHRMLRQWTHRELSLLTHEQLKYVGRSKNTDGAVLGDYYIPMGEFAVVKCVSEGETAQTVTAYDRLAFADKPYIPRVKLPADAGAIADDILDMLGIPGRIVPDSGEFICADDGVFICAGDGEFICSGEYTFTITDIPDGASCRDVLGYIAAMYGRNGVLDRSGMYTTVFISDSGQVYDADKIDEPSLSEGNVSIAGISCAVDSNTTLTVGDVNSVYSVNISCPYMTADRLNDIWNSIRTISWRPAESSERLADPRRDIGDLMYYDNTAGRYSLPVSSLTFHFDGGLSADVSSCGQVETDCTEQIFVMTSSIGDMELLTIAELEERTIAQLEG